MTLILLISFCRYNLSAIGTSRKAVVYCPPVLKLDSYLDSDVKRYWQRGCRNVYIYTFVYLHRYILHYVVLYVCADCDKYARIHIHTKDHVYISH